MTSSSRRAFLTVMAATIAADAASRPHPGLRVAMAQIPAEDGDLARNMQLASDAAAQAARGKADFFCLPEAADFGWLDQEAHRDALPIPGKYTGFLAQLAVRHKMWVSAGCLERAGEKVFNSAVILDRTGRIVLKHRKIRTLPELTSHLYEAGTVEDIRAVDTEFGRIGLTICADNFDLDIPRRVASLGAWLLITPHGFAAPEDKMEKNAQDYQAHISRVAKAAGMWVVGTDVVLCRVRGGAWKDQMHCGCSMIARPDGTPAIIGKFKQPDLVLYEIPAAA
jgi:predicted amidohydrolase